MINILFIIGLAALARLPNELIASQSVIHAWFDAIKLFGAINANE
jgi:hypothetical protein